MSQTNAPGTAASSGSGSQAMEKVHERAEVAKDEVRDLSESAREEIRSFADEARSQVRSRIDDESAQLGDAVRRFGDDLRDLGHRAEDPGSPAARTATMVGERVSQVADEYQRKGVHGVLEDVKGFARRHPAQFLLGAAAAGFVVGRLVRNVDTAAVTPGSNGEDSSRSMEGQPDVIDLTDDGRPVGERPLPSSEQLGVAPAGGGPRGPVAGIAGEEVGTW